MDGPKFNLVEVVFGSLIALTIDVVSAFADVPTAGIGGFVIQVLTWLLFTLVFYFKGATVTASLVRRFLVPIAVALIPVIPTQIFVFLVSVYMENHPEKFGLVTTAVALGKMDVKKIKQVKEAGGKIAGAKEAIQQYRTAKEEIENEPSEAGKRIKKIGEDMKTTAQTAKEKREGKQPEIEERKQKLHEDVESASSALDAAKKWREDYQEYREAA